MKKMLSLVTVVGLLAIPAASLADDGCLAYTGQFSGHADNGSGTGGSWAGGDTYTAYLTLDTTQDNPWYPWDSNKEYTAVLSTTISSYTNFGGAQEVVDFGVASVDIYEDDVTAANYGNLSTFTDGTNILSGEAQNMIGDRVIIFGLPLAVTGVVVFDSGSGLGNLIDCTTGLVMNDFIDFTFASNPTGFEEGYDAEWKCCPTTSVDASNWGSVKALYR